MNTTTGRCIQVCCSGVLFSFRLKAAAVYEAFDVRADVPVIFATVFSTVSDRFE